MISTTFSCHLNGIETDVIKVEATIIRAFPSFSIVGLAGTAIQESRERIRASLLSIGHKMPLGKVLINLYPSDLRKKGSHWDLPIAISICGAMDIIDPAFVKDKAFIGELSLDGKVRPVAGAYSMVWALKEGGLKDIFLPYENLKACKNIQGVYLYPCSSLSQLLAHIKGIKKIEPVKGEELPLGARKIDCGDFADVIGREGLKRMIQISVSGRHSLLFCGWPGLGKSMLLKRIPSILPPLSVKERDEVFRIHSLLEINEDLSSYPPFRNPHQSVSVGGMIGGGNPPLPGEVSLAHKGVLFLDELPHFSLACLESLRTPMEKHSLLISRAGRRLHIPADFQLVAAMNPCPCGYYGDKKHNCTCKPYEIERYLKKISGPFLDRLDMVKEIPIRSDNDIKRTSSADLYSDIQEARDRQRFRYKKEEFIYNSRIKDSFSTTCLSVDYSAEKCLEYIRKNNILSDRQTRKTLCLARTIADLRKEKK